MIYLTSNSHKDAHWVGRTICKQGKNFKRENIKVPKRNQSNWTENPSQTVPRGSKDLRDQDGESHAIGRGDRWRGLTALSWPHQVDKPAWLAAPEGEDRGRARTQRNNGWTLPLTWGNKQKSKSVEPRGFQKRWIHNSPTLRHYN